MNLYNNFFDLHPDDGPSLVNGVQLRFISRMTVFLQSAYRIKESVATAIAYSVFYRMLDTSLHYHTPVHVLAIFDFAAANEIKLEPWEELAVWFHDSVYDVDNILGDNERLSADFMYAMMRPYVKNAYDANMAIIQTSCHLEPKCSEKYAKILDLDMSGFATPRETHKIITECIRREYSHVDITTFNVGRKAFLTKLIAKGPIYRTPAFAKFEPLAQENIRLDLEELNAAV